MFEMDYVETKVSENKCAFVLHGLNTNPNRMRDLAHIAERAQFETRIGILTGHSNDRDKKQTEKITDEQWKKDFSAQWNSTIERCKDNSSQRLFIAYSLGALTGLEAFDSGFEKILPTQMILIAPALALRAKTWVIKAISWLPLGSLPSLNHPDYRARDWTPLASYDALFKINKIWKTFSWKNTKDIPTLLALSDEDELVDSQQIEKQLQQRQANNWQITWVSNELSQLKPKYHHLIIDAASQGQAQWDSFSQTIEKFLKKSQSEK